MPTIIIDVKGKPYEIKASENELAGLGAVHARYKEHVGALDDKDLPTYATDGDFLDAQIQDRIKQFPDEDFMDIARRALASWAGHPIPDAVVTEMSPDARSSMLIAYAAEKRYAVACAGVTIGGLAVPSGDTASTRIDRAIRDIDEGIVADPVTFVVGSTVVPAKRSMLMEMRSAISKRWQAAYVVQGDVVTGINDGSITTRDQINAAKWS